jgi:hypothetical protein
MLDKLVLTLQDELTNRIIDANTKSVLIVASYEPVPFVGANSRNFKGACRLLEVKIIRTGVSIYKVPTDAPEADGTFAWDSTTMVLVQMQTIKSKALELKGSLYGSAGLRSYR